MDIGIRELKAHLSEYVGRAADGEAIVVTDRGRPVARLLPLHDDLVFQRGIDEGWIEPARLTRLEPIPRVTAPVPSLAMLDEDRG